MSIYLLILGAVAVVLAAIWAGWPSRKWRVVEQPWPPPLGTVVEVDGPRGPERYRLWAVRHDVDGREYLLVEATLPWGTIHDSPTTRRTWEWWAERGKVTKA